jgi:hypothetical protein
MPKINTISEYEVLELLLEAYPQSRDHLVSCADDWIPESGPISSHALMMSLTPFVASALREGDYTHAESLFALIEMFITDGSPSVAEAACTCFVESLQNIASHEGDFEYSNFVDLLGPASRDYAKAWDGFTGVATDEL